MTNIHPTETTRLAPRRAIRVAVGFLVAAGFGLAVLSPALAGPGPGAATMTAATAGEAPELPGAPVAEVAVADAPAQLPVVTTSTTAPPAATTTTTISAPPAGPVPMPVVPEPTSSTTVTTVRPLSLQGHYDCFDVEQASQYELDCERDVAPTGDEPVSYGNPFVDLSK